MNRNCHPPSLAFFALVLLVMLPSALPLRAQVLPDNLTLTNITIQGQPRTLQLYKRSVRAATFHYLTWSSAGGYVTNTPTPVRTYRGTVVGATNTIVCAVIKPGGLLQADGFDYERGKSYTWQLNNVNVSSQLTPGSYRLLPGSSIPVEEAIIVEPDPALDAPCGCPECGGELPALPVESGPAVALAALPPSTYMPPAGGMQVMPLGVDITHYRYVNTYAGNADLAVSSIEHTVNIYDHLMARDAKVAIQQSVVVLRQDIFYVPTGMGDQLNKMLTEWKNTSAPMAGLPWSQVYSFATEQGLFGAGGYAWGNQIGKSQSPACVEALYHEAGHNWDVVHLVYGADTMGGNRPNHGPFSIDRLLRKRNEAMGNGALTPYPGTYPDPLPPYTHVDCASTLTNTPVNINVLTNDWDGNGNALTVIGWSTNTTKGGTVTFLGNGVLRYSPPTHYVGKDIFAYTVQDSTGLKTRDIVHVEVINRDLAVQYSFEETSGKNTADLTGNGHPGRLQGASDFSTHSEPGVSGNAIRVEGGGIVCDNSPLMPPDAPVVNDINYWPFDADMMSRGNFFDPMDESCTIAFWFKTDDASATRSILRKQWHDEHKVGFNVTIGGTGFTATVREFNGLSNVKTLTWATVPAAGRWYHVALQFDRTANQARLHVDGVQRATAALDAGRFIFQGRQPLLLGMDSGGQMVFDEFRYYTKALTLPEIQALYAVGHIAASGPSPADGERDVTLAPVLTWVAGRTNYQHDVFFGTNLAAVAAATTNSPEYAARRPVASYTPGALLPDTQYFWRVDQLLGGTNVAPGGVWSFRTAVDAIHGGLRLQLTLDARDTIGNTTYDRAGPPFQDGTLTNSPVATAGQVAQAFEFNGSNQDIRVSPLNMPTDTATLLAWVRRNGSQNSFAGIVFHRGTGGTSGMHVTSANRLGYHWNDTAASYNYNNGPLIPDVQWALVALVVEPTRAFFYLGTTNGVLTRTTNTTTHALTGFGDVFRVGSDNGNSARSFKGAIDEVGIWNRALSQAEIGQILTNGIAGGGIDGPPPLPQPGTFTWTGDANNAWNNAGNWATNATPGASNVVIFDESSAKNLNTDLGVNQSVAGALITGKLRALGISATAGNTLSLGSAGLNLSNSFTSLTLAAPTILLSNQVWSISEFATLSLAANLTNSGRSLTLANQGTINLNGVITGTGGLTNGGPGRTYFNQLNTYSGQTTVNGGEVVLNAWSWPSGLALGSGTLVIQSNGWVRTAQPHVFSASGSNPIRIFGGRLTFGSEAYVNASFEMTGGSFDGTGEWRMQGNPTFRAAATPAVVSVPVNGMAGARTFTVENGPANPDLAVLGVIFNCTTLTKAGPGTMQLIEPPTYTGNTVISAGTLALLGGKDTLPQSMAVSNNTGAILALNNNDQTLSSLTGNGSVQLGYGALTLSLLATQTFGGSISGSPVGAPPPSGNTEEAPNPGGFTKAGTGKLTFTAAQTYTGDTLINSGVLALSGSGALAGSSNILISSAGILDVTTRSGASIPLSAGQTLKGNGKVLGAVIVNNGSTVSPGESVGSLITGAQTWAGGGIYQWEIEHATIPGSSDSLTVTGAVNITATSGNPFLLRLVSPGGPLPGFNSASNYTWLIATTTAGIGGYASNKFAVDASGLGIDRAGGTFSVAQQGNSLVVKFDAFVAPPLTPPGFTGITASNGFISLSVTGAPGQIFVLQGTTNLAPPSWQLLSTQTVDSGGLVLFTDPQATNHPQRFYRINLQP